MHIGLLVYPVVSGLHLSRLSLFYCIYMDEQFDCDVIWRVLHARWWLGGRYVLKEHSWWKSESKVSYQSIVLTMLLQRWQCMPHAVTAMWLHLSVLLVLWLMVFCGFCQHISTHPKHTKRHHKSQASCLLLLPRHCKGCQCESDSLLPVFPVSRSVSGQRGDTDSRYQGPHPAQLTQRHMVSLCFWLWLWLPFSGQEKRGRKP